MATAQAAMRQQPWLTSVEHRATRLRLCPSRAGRGADTRHSVAASVGMSRESARTTPPPGATGRPQVRGRVSLDATHVSGSLPDKGLVAEESGWKGGTAVRLQSKWVTVGDFRRFSLMHSSNEERFSRGLGGQARPLPAQTVGPHCVSLHCLSQGQQALSGVGAPRGRSSGEAWPGSREQGGPHPTALEGSHPPRRLWCPPRARRALGAHMSGW